MSKDRLIFKFLLPFYFIHENVVQIKYTNYELLKHQQSNVYYSMAAIQKKNTIVLPTFVKHKFK